MYKLTLWILPLVGDWFVYKVRKCENETERALSRIELDEIQESYQALGIIAHVTEEQCYSLSY